MEEQQIIDLAREAIWLTVVISTPIMMVGLVVGVIIALFQALTQIQEMTLAFVPKIIAIFLAIFMLMPIYVIKMNDFMNIIADQIVSGGLG